MLGTLSETLGDDLCVERVGEDLRPILERPIGRDQSGAAVVVALADDLERKLGLRGVHGEDSEVIDGEEIGADVAAQGFFERAVQLGGVQLVKHFGGGDEHDTLGGVAGLEGQRAREKCLSGAWRADEEGIDALLEEGEIVEAEVAGAHLLATGREVEIERVDGVDLGEPGIGDAPLDGGALSVLGFGEQGGESAALRIEPVSLEDLFIGVTQ